MRFLPSGGDAEVRFFYGRSLKFSPVGVDDGFNERI